MHLVYRIILIATLLFTFSSQGWTQDEPEINITEISGTKKYGKKPKTAIEVGTVSNEYDYLKQLCGPNGEKIRYKRLKSCCQFNCPSCPMGSGLLDIWEIRYDGLKEPIILYLNGYIYNNPKAPKGFGIR